VLIGFSTVKKINKKGNVLFEIVLICE